MGVSVTPVHHALGAMNGICGGGCGGICGRRGVKGRTKRGDGESKVEGLVATSKTALHLKIIVIE